MAESNEDIIIIEESEAATFNAHSEDEDLSNQDSSSKKKKLILFGAGGVVLVVLIILIMMLTFGSSKKEQQPISMKPIEEKLVENKQKPIEPSKLENMIAKANYMYSSGSKQEALALYEKIATFSEAISLYNLGVAQLKNKQYKTALQTFQKAIENDEKRCVSAINAAVCSLHLNDKESFEYNIDLAYAYLPNEIDSPLYSYYYALINYYNNNYIEALSALKNPTSHEYPITQNHLSAKINALFGNNYDAIEAMEKGHEQKDVFSLGLLYARVGDITLAKKYFDEAILKNIEPARAELALGLINLKAGLIGKAANDIKNVTDMFPKEVYKYYPITVTLKESLFNPDKAQQLYRNKVKRSKSLNFQKIFYFSPYKVFNANKTISYIRKGNANVYIDNIGSAKEYLKKSASSSNVNLGIAKAIKKALTFRVREANEELQKLVKIQPKHSILQYNLGLTYAQLGNMQEAYTHFLRSYYLDAKNYLSGIFAVMTGQLINKDTFKLKSIIKESIAQEDPSETTNLYMALLNINDDNILSSADWLEKDYQQKPLYLALDVIIAMNLNRVDLAKKSSLKLTLQLPNDILPHMMYIDANFSDLKTKAYAREVQNYLKEQTFNFDDLYYGPRIVRYLYTQQNLITGRLYFLTQQLKSVLESTTEDTREITSALALASLYAQDFEESFTLYNQLIDNLKVRDANTLLLGAVASTAADHHENATALLELSKLKNSELMESRYALGLLYLQLRNNEAAIIQFSEIGNSGFNSEYFNFKINIDKLFFEKEQQQNVEKKDNNSSL